MMLWSSELTKLHEAVKARTGPLLSNMILIGASHPGDSLLC